MPRIHADESDFEAASPTIESAQRQLAELISSFSGGAAVPSDAFGNSPGSSYSEYEKAIEATRSGLNTLAEALTTLQQGLESIANLYLTDDEKIAAAMDLGKK